MTDFALYCEEIFHHYGDGGHRVEVLTGVDLILAAGDSAVLVGPSGSGKTTLLSIAGCLLTPSSGRLMLAGVEATAGNLLSLRREKIGFVFQHAQLLPFLSVRENLEVVAANLGVSGMGERIDDLLERLEMREHAEKKAAVLSGGQRQRVSVARALLGKPAVILADEPTAALGWEHGKVVVDLLHDASRNEGCALLVVTHDERLVPSFERKFRIQKGSIIEL